MTTQLASSGHTTWQQKVLDTFKFGKTLSENRFKQISSKYNTLQDVWTIQTSSQRKIKTLLTFNNAETLSVSLHLYKVNEYKSFCQTTSLRLLRFVQRGVLTSCLAYRPFPVSLMSSRRPPTVRPLIYLYSLFQSLLNNKYLSILDTIYNTFKIIRTLFQKFIWRTI